LTKGKGEQKVKKLHVFLLAAVLFLIFAGCDKSKGTGLSIDDTSSAVTETAEDQESMTDNIDGSFIETNETAETSGISEATESSERVTGDESLASESRNTDPVTEETSMTVKETEKTGSNIFTLTSWANIYYAGEDKGWQKGPDHLKTAKDDTSGGMVTYLWNLGEYSAELSYTYTDNQEQAAVSITYYTAAWTIPGTITPGETVKIPITFSGYGKDIYYIDGEKYTDELPFSLTSFAFAETYFGKIAGEEKTDNWLTFATDYYLTGADGDDDVGYAEIDMLDWPASYTVLEIYVINTCMGMEIGKVYYYER
jgi:hypothetical protein